MDGVLSGVVSRGGSGKNKCIENMKEIGNKFSHGMLCAGGKKKGTCFVRTTFLVNISLIKLN